VIQTNGIYENEVRFYTVLQFMKKW